MYPKFLGTPQYTHKEYIKGHIHMVHTQGTHMPHTCQYTHSTLIKSTHRACSVQNTHMPHTCHTHVTHTVYSRHTQGAYIWYTHTHTWYNQSAHTYIYMVQTEGMHIHKNRHIWHIHKVLNSTIIMF